MSSPALRRAWGWVDHLQAGGTTAWAEWTREGADRGPLLPGAQQLELLRRVNLVGAASPDLAATIVTASAPGRGRPDFELVDVAPKRNFGPAPVDPGQLPRTELLRVATSVIADQVVAVGTPEPSARRPWPRPWRRRVRVVGDPVLAAPWREALVAAGRPPGGRDARILVLATDLGTMLTHAYRARLADTGAPPWGSWLRLLRKRDHLPPRADVLRMARTWSERVGAGRIHVVIDPTAVPQLVGLRRGRVDVPAELTPDGLELGRQVAAVLGVLVRPERRRDLVTHILVPRLARLASGPGPTVPARHRDWLHDQAERQRSGIAAAGFTVHGDLADLMPQRGQRGRGQTGRGPEGPRAGRAGEDAVLGLAIAMLHDGSGVPGSSGGEAR